MYANRLKRLFDIIISTVMLVLLLPALLLIAILIKLTSNGPVFFKQERVGQNKRIFNVLKFRTMTHAQHDLSIQTIPGDTNITFIGTILRRVKIDELPQVINILKGDMSLIGPRPCLPNLLAELNEQGEKRFSCRPGLTGLAQINGNIYLTWEERWQYDAEYVKNISFICDFKILLKTILVVLLGEQKFKRNT